jgi:hypothetical protein
MADPLVVVILADRIGLHIAAEDAPGLDDKPIELHSRIDEALYKEVSHTAILRVRLPRRLALSPRSQCEPYGQRRTAWAWPPRLKRVVVGVQVQVRGIPDNQSNSVR